MARPRVFISSTYYDLRQVREDLERMIRELGYEPVRNETGSIPYAKDEELETSAYREVELSDIIVAIVGGRFGAESQVSPGSSISQEELRRALDQGVQVYIFIEQSVNAEYQTYLLNKKSADVKYRFVDDPRIYEFVEKLHALPKNNAIATFETSIDITNHLREQWAGLFQRFLSERQRISQVKVLEQMHATAQTLKETVDFLTKDSANRDEAFKSVVLMNHPAFRRFQAVTKTTYRVFFTDRHEFEEWMKARGWQPVSKDDRYPDSVEEWMPRRKGSDDRILITKELFDSDGKLLPFAEGEWNDDWVSFDDGDIPF